MSLKPVSFPSCDRLLGFRDVAIHPVRRHSEPMKAFWNKRDTKITGLWRKCSHFTLSGRRLWTQWGQLYPAPRLR